MRFDRFAPLAAAATLAAGGALAPQQAPARMIDAVAEDVMIIRTDDGMTAVFELDSFFEEAREVKAAVQSVHGEDAVEATGGGADPEIVDQLAAGEPLPEAAETSDISAELAPKLPEWADDWVALGEHLVALSPDDRVMAVYYDMLP